MGSAGVPPASDGPRMPDQPPAPPEEESAEPIEVPRHEIPPPLPGRKGSAAEIRSLDRHVCPECGGKGEWNPGKAKLVCPYCGTAFDRVAPPPPPGSIVEHDLDAMLAELGEAAHELDTASRRVQCSHCHAVLQRDATDVAQSCDFCGSPELLDYEDLEAPIRPESLLPASVSKEKAYHSLKGFLGSKWFAPNDLKRKNLIDRIHGVYLPYWTFDAAAECPWTAQSGTYYYVTVRTSKGTRRERRTRWRPASGHVSTWFDDIVISGSGGIDRALLKELEPFPLADLVPYETRYVSGWHVEHYQLPLMQAARAGFQRMNQLLREMCAGEVPGDTYRNLQISPSYTRKTFKHLLVPVWLIAYQYRGKTYQGAVNAVTGEASARYPKSPWKIAFVVVLVLLAIGLVVFLFGR